MKKVVGLDEALAAGKKKTQLEAEKTLLKDLLVMSDDLGDIEEPLLSIDQVAVKLGVSSQTVRNWEKQGKLPPAQRTAGGHRRYPQKDITDFMKSQDEFEILMKINPGKLLDTLTQVMSNFSPTEDISVSIRNDPLNRKVHFTLNSEDGLCTFTKTMKMED